MITFSPDYKYFVIPESHGYNMLSRRFSKQFFAIGGFGSPHGHP